MKQKLIFFLLVIGSFAQFTNAQLSTLPSSIVRDYQSFGWIYFKPDSASVGDLFTHYKSSFFSDPDDSMGVVKVNEDSLLHFEHYRYQQYYKGIPVEGCEFIEHAYHNYLVYANGKICSGINRIYSDQIISERDAMENVLAGGEYWNDYLSSLSNWNLPIEEYSIEDAIFAWEDSLWEADLKTETGDSNATYFPTGKLVFGLINMSNIEYDTDESNFRLAWKFDIYCLFPDIHIQVYVDAITGDIVKVYNKVHYDGPATIPGHGSQTIDTKHRGWPNNDYILQTDNGNFDIHTKLHGSGSPWATTAEVDDNDDDWGTSNQLATAPHWMATKAWAYFTTVHGRQGMDNNNVVRVRTDHSDYGASYDKVLGFDIIRVGYFDGAIYSGDLAIVAHEFTHGVDEHEGDLSYVNESGALDESYADIFGFLTRRWVTSTTNWHIGVPSALPRDRRNMQNPNSLGFHYDFNFDSTTVTEASGQPDTYGGTYWHPWQSSSNDIGGVHINSGVMNHWFYMLAMGEVGVNDLSNAYVVNGIGIDKAATITYYNFINNMQNNSQYIDAMEGAIAFAQIYYGICSNEHIQTQNAWYAAGLGSSSSCANVSIEENELNFSMYPNPATEIVNVTFSDNSPKTIEVYSVTGQLLYTFVNVSDDRYTVDVSSLAKGTYIINVIGNTTNWAKFVKE